MTAKPLPVQTKLSDTDESLTDEAIDQPAAEVDVMGGCRDEEDGNVRRLGRCRRAPKRFKTIDSISLYI